MPLITITSDYGNGSPYLAALQGSLVQAIPDAKILVISNNVLPYNLAMAAYLVKTNYFYFPEGTWHFICVETSLQQYKQILVVEFNKHFFVAADNGIFSMLFGAKASNIYELTVQENNFSNSFIEQDLFVKAAAHFFRRGDLKGVAQPGKILNQKVTLNPVYDGNKMQGSVLFIDGYGNAICNISLADFQQFIGSNKFKILYSRRHGIDKISNNYEFEQAGEELALFNRNNYLEIAVTLGNASQLLGLKPGSNIIIEKFND